MLFGSDSERRTELYGSLLTFTRYFYQIRNNREFILPKPIGRESHTRIICNQLMRCEEHQTNRLGITIPPRYGKTELIIHFIAWAMARWPDANFLYTSYSYSLARKQTGVVKEIVMLPEYQRLFPDVRIKRDASAKDNFETTKGGSVYAAGAGGTITGRGAGIKYCPRFGGALIMDDMHKPEEVFSDPMREGVRDWYFNTLLSRANDPAHTPIIFIGQRLHEDDLPSHLFAGEDTYPWDIVDLAVRDGAGNVLDPAMHTKEQLEEMEKKEPYLFWTQYMQKPLPPGGSVFKREAFILMDDLPEIFHTFITVDSAETDNNWNDQTCFSFWGLYKIRQFGVETELYGLHWLACEYDWIDAGDLEQRFIDFYGDCMRFKVKPTQVAIEKKSTGVTLRANLKKVQGIQIVESECLQPKISKGARFLKCVKFVNSGQISLTKGARHTDHCIEHMSKITLEDAHKLDDIADTAAIAIQIALIDRTVINMGTREKKGNKILEEMMGGMRAQERARGIVYNQRGY